MINKLFKKRFVFLILGSLMWACTPLSSESSSSKGSELTLRAQLGGISYRGGKTIIHVATTLENPSDDTIRFLTMNCSYEDFFLINDSIHFQVSSSFSCYTNRPSIDVLGPHLKTDRYLMVETSLQAPDLAKLKMRVGMIYQVADSGKYAFDEYNRFKVDMQAKPIIWSNEIALKRLYRTAY